jgi:hypothetical protein
MLSWASIAATTAGGTPLGRRLGSHAARLIRVTGKLIGGARRIREVRWRLPVL